MRLSELARCPVCGRKPSAFVLSRGVGCYGRSGDCHDVFVGGETYEEAKERWQTCFGMEQDDDRG